MSAPSMAGRAGRMAFSRCFLPRWQLVMEAETLPMPPWELRDAHVPVPALSSLPEAALSTPGSGGLP